MMISYIYVGVVFYGFLFYIRVFYVCLSPWYLILTFFPLTNLPTQLYAVCTVYFVLFLLIYYTHSKLFQS